MARTRITREAIEALERQGTVDRREMAKALGVSVSGLDRARGRYGMRDKRPDRSWIFEPWLPIAEEDYHHTYAQYLRWVGLVADNEDVPAAQLNPAAKFLISLREGGMRYEYDRTLPNKEDRWFTVATDKPEEAHEQKVLDKAIAARTRKRRQRRRNA